MDFGEWLKRYFVSPQFEYEKEKARLTHFQATEKELQVKVLEGDLVPAESVRDLLSQLSLICRSKLLALPGRAAQSAIDARDVKTIESDIRDLVYEALEEISHALSNDDPRPHKGE